MKKIIVIEDNTDVRENLVEILELSGYEVFEAENGKKGVSKILEIKPDLILCDVMMPELDGFGVLKIVNSNPEIADIPFLFLTAKTEYSDLRKGMGLGADDYITKPFDDVDLLTAIELRLNKRARLGSKLSSGLHTFINEANGNEVMQKLADDREQRIYSKKDIVFEKGQYPNWLFYIVKGQIKTFLTNDFGKDIITNIYGAGEFFGYNPIVLSTPYLSSAICTQDSIVKMIPPDEFKDILGNDRDLSIVYIKHLTNVICQNNSKLLDFAYSSVRKKVANALLLLQSKQDSNLIKIRREDLAGIAGTAKETTIRTISDFKSEKLIKIANSAIEILDSDGLRKMSQ
ncbi:MAG: response regulator [Saprospiraceae bacterium]